MALKLYLYKKGVVRIYLTVKQKVKHLSKDEYKSIKKLSHIAKNLTNEAIYNIRQYYFNEGLYLNYEKNYTLLKNSNNYRLLNSNMAQQILKEVDGSFKSFFGLLKLAKKGKYNFKDIKLPSYLDKNGFTTLVIGFIRIKDDTLLIPYSYLFASEHKRISIKIPTILKNKKIKEIRIIPKLKARYFEIQYVYESKIEKLNLNKENALGIDLGINNLCTCVMNNGETFIIDGRKLKSINQFYNKRNASLQALKDTKKKIKEKIKLLQAKIIIKRNNRVNDYLSKTAKTIINYCIENNIGKIVIGYNVTFQRNSNIGKINNQNFVNIPYGKLRNKLEYLCDMYGIECILQEESYTSKASFWDKDEISIFDENTNKKYKFSGRRIKRGLYRTSTGYEFNADCNGALNILRKSNVVSLEALYSRGELDTPKRIRII